MFYAIKNIELAQALHEAEAELVLSRYCNSWLKRTFDVVLSLAALLALLPFFMAVAVLVKLTSKGPIFFGHVRCGRGGRMFKCWKFRTMVVDAQQRLSEALKDPKNAAEWNKTQKLANDPRVTPIGGILRKLSIDELPQLWNIFFGDMSIVGPRPVTETELARYRADVVYYLSVTPGLTGAWQVGGRSSTTYEERVALDKGYVTHANFWGDVAIILKTFTILTGDRNAM